MDNVNQNQYSSQRKSDHTASSTGRFRLGKEQVQWGITAFGVIAASIMLYYLIFHGEILLLFLSRMTKLMMGVIIGVVLAYILSPVVNFLEGHIGKPYYRKRGINILEAKNKKYFQRMRFLSVFVTLFLVLTVIYVLIMIIVPQVVDSVKSIVDRFPRYYQNIYNLTNRFLISYPEISAAINQYLLDMYDQTQTLFNEYVLPNVSSFTNVFSIITEGFMGLGKTLVNTLIGIVVSVYLLNSKEVFLGQGKKIIYGLFKESTANEILAECRFIHYTFIGFLAGKIIDSIIIGILCFIGTSILHIPYALLISVVVGITNIIPVFGPYIGGIFGCLLVLIVNPMSALILLIFILILQQLDGNIIGPTILGSSTGLSTFWVLFSILLFGGLFGLVGWIIGVPLFAVIYAAFAKFINKKLSIRELPLDLPKYMECAYIENGEILSKNDPENIKFRTHPPKNNLRSIFGKRSAKNNNESENE